jgi:hypothetical protein
MGFVMYFICVGLLSMFAYIAIMLVRNEVEKSKWSPTMKVGDDVNFSTLSNNVNAVITNLNPTDDENIVEVTVLVYKKSLYPGRVRDIDGSGL